MDSVAHLCICDAQAFIDCSRVMISPASELGLGNGCQEYQSLNVTSEVS